MALRGCDLSHWNSDTVFSKVFNYADFFIFKATESTGSKDNTTESRIDKCIKKGKRVGLYHFWRNTDPKKQLTNFDKVYAKFYDYAVPVIDLEINGINWNNVKAFVDAFYKKYKVFPMLYVDNTRYKQIPKTLRDNCDIWIARYNNSMGFTDIKQLYPLAVGWQYTSKGDFANQKVAVDCSYFFEDVFTRHVKIVSNLTKTK